MAVYDMTSAHIATDKLLVAYAGIQYSTLWQKEMLNPTGYSDRGASFKTPAEVGAWVTN